MQPNEGPSSSILPNFEIAGVNGFALSEDKAQAFLRCHSADGFAFTLQVAANLLPSLIGALEKVRDAASASQDSMAGLTLPKTWSVATVPGYDGMLVIFDHHTPAQSAVGLDVSMARNLGHALIRETAKRPIPPKPKFIMPEHQITV